MKPSYRQIPRASVECEDDTSRPKRQLHPFSLILLILWGSFTVGLLCLLEVAVTHGPRSAREDDNFHPSWTLITLPTILLTVFTQAHVPITAFHLARIAVSALENPKTTPNSWAELFWLADQEWTGPVGIVKTAFISIRSRTRASFNYILFATTCAVALVTPVLLSQAYQVRQVLITGLNREIRLSAVSLSDMSYLGPEMLSAVGLASWETGLSVTDMYNTSLFIPKEQPRDTTLHPQDFFFAGDIGNASAILPGLRLQGNCAPLDIRDPVFLSDDLTIQVDFFNKYARSHGTGLDDEAPTYQLWQNLTDFDANLTLAIWDQIRPGSESGILLYNYDGSATPSSIKMHGLIQCNSTVSTGTASISGVDRTYTNFTRQNVTGQEGPIDDPIFNFLNTFNHRPPALNSSDSMDFSNSPIFRGFGFDPGNTIHLPDPPSPLTISEGLWSGAAHYVAALATLYKKQDQPFNASVPRNVALYTRDTHYAVAAYVMFILWLTLLAVATAWGYRRSFSPSLNSYVAAELIYRERFLLEDVPIGAAGDNDRLKAPFKPVGLCSDRELAQELKRRSTT
ncbi:hypothetical protein V5O48_009838 [Marasmius crinis-equi]|uniref:Transmembrane protein n=1 Tax=Marasmius crinis-equi TaxID=585013 RepID=A0ABR3F9Z7_9AGAR